MSHDLAEFHGPVPRPSSGAGGIGLPKKARALDAPAATKAEIRVLKCRACRLCGETQAIQPHHLVPRGMGGTIGGEWVEANIVGLCGHGNVDGCHGLVEKHDPDACHVLRTLLEPHEVRYIVEKKGQAWLDKRYPLAVAK